MKQLCLVLTVIIAAANVQAGYYYKAVTNVIAEGGNNMETVVEAWVEGLNGRIEFRETDNPMVQPGAYLITNDGGKTMYLVNDQEKTYMKWDIDQMVQMAGSIMEGMSGLVDMKFENPGVQQLSAGEGPRIKGMATTHYKHKTTYGIEVKVLGMRRYQETETIQDTWTTTAIDDEAFGMWLRNEPPSSGNEDLDELIRNQMTTVKGFALKSKAVSVTKQYNRKRTKVRNESKSVTETNVTDFRKENIPGARFKIPSEYTETQMIGQDEEGGSPFKNIFKKNGN